MRGKEASEARIQQARRGTAAGAMNNEVDRAVTTALDRALAPILRDLPIMREKLEVLNGDRRKALSQAAIRRGQVEELNNLSDPVSTKAAGATPTAAEFDALVEDVHRVMATLKALRNQ